MCISALCIIYLCNIPFQLASLWLIKEIILVQRFYFQCITSLLNQAQFSVHWKHTLFYFIFVFSVLLKIFYEICVHYLIPNIKKTAGMCKSWWSSLYICLIISTIPEKMMCSISLHMLMIWVEIQVGQLLIKWSTDKVMNF